MKMFDSIIKIRSTKAISCSPIYNYKKNGKDVPWPSSVAQVSFEIGTSQNTKRGLQGMTKGKEVLYAATALDASLRQGRNTWVFQEWTDARGKLLERNPRG